MKKTKVYFRADGNATIGLGHVIRSLALAEILKEHFSCHFIIRNPLQTLKNLILEVCASIIEIEIYDSFNDEAASVVKDYISSSDIIVLDGYQFDLGYQNTLKKNGNKVVFIDDIQHCHFTADIVINHAPGLSKKDFSKEEYTKVYHGPSYSMLRKPFYVQAKKRRKITEIKRVFICFGGSDNANLTQKVIESLLSCNLDLQEINIVIGSANIARKNILNFKTECFMPIINVYENQTADEMVKIMNMSNLAIVPASGIMYETIAAGLITIGGFYVDNQKKIYSGFNKAKSIIGIGDYNIFQNYCSLIKKISKKDIALIQQNHKNLKIQSASQNLLALFLALETRTNR